MFFKLRSIFGQLCRFFKGIAVKVTKRMYRSSAVFMAGAAVITVIAFTSAGFGSGGKNALTAFAETPPGEEEEESESEEAVLQELEQVRTKALQLAGDLLEKEELEKIRLKEEIKQEAKRQKAAQAEKEAKEAQAASAMAISSEDYQVLLRIVQAEAGVCDEKGKILVANVVLNRVKSSQFPDTVKKVVYAPSQFSPVSNGSINSVKVTEETMQCVDRALAGEDYSEGALFFMNRRGSKRGAVSWFDSRLTYLFQHGGHEFFK